MLAPLSAAATDPSSTVSQGGSADNSPSPQVNLDDVFASQTLNVDTVTGTTAAVTTATGNALLTGVEAGALNVVSSQTNAQADDVLGNINAHTILNVANGSGETTMMTAATGNTAEADISGGGSLTGTFTQVTNGSPSQAGGAAAGLFISSENDFYAPTGNATDLAVISQAIANSVSIGNTGSLASPIIDQTNHASILANVDHIAPGESSALIDYTAGTASFTSIAVGNNVNITGISAEDGTGTSVYAHTTQYTDGAAILAGVVAFANDAQTVQGATAVSANNVSVNNQSGDLNLTNVQTNNTFSQADTVVGAFEFGTGSATASGVGNSVLAANYGPTTEFSNNQTNNSEVQASATFTGGNTGGPGGGPSYDATASASAIGNGATAFSCSDCGGVIDVGNSQTNTNSIGATTLMDITGTNRSVTATATAVGNSATFYASKPK